MAPYLLDLRPDQVTARKNGLKTAYVPRPLEFGPGKEAEPPDPSFDLVAEDFVELARKLAS
jgi:2-haloacid dehalogenase